MRRPWTRFTVGRLMAVVAVIAVGLGATEARRLDRQSREYRQKAGVAASEERDWRRTLAKRRATEAEARRLGESLRTQDPYLAEDWKVEAANCSREVENAREFVAHHAGLRQKYERAASRPWEPVAPDPPEPPWKLIWRSTSPPKEPLLPGEPFHAEGLARRRATNPAR